MSLIVREGSIQQAYELSLKIPEFKTPYYEESEYIKRLADCESCVLIAYNNEEPVAFKAGYQREYDGSFYSWMGGVIPKYRNNHIAQELLTCMENWAKEKGYAKIKFKTRNRNKAMLLFAIKNNFKIVDVLKKDTADDNRIVLEKLL